MFYIKEIGIRLKYFGLAFLLSTSICFYNKSILLFLLTFKVIGSNSKLHKSSIDYFIYTHPSELLKTYLIIILYFSFFALLPYVLLSCLDFLMPSILKSQYQYIKSKIKSSIFIVYFCNCFCFFLLFPSCWAFFEFFNYASTDLTTINFHFELKIQDYLSFLKDFLYSANICLILLLFLNVVIDFLDLKKLLWWKRPLLVSSLTLVTFISPPDFFMQIFDVLLIVTFFELIMIRHITKHKAKLNVKLLQVKIRN